MILSVLIGTVCLITQMVIAPQIDNTFWSLIVHIIAAIGYLVTLDIALDKENKLKDRIKALEDKLNDKEGKQ